MKTYKATISDRTYSEAVGPHKVGEFRPSRRFRYSVNKLIAAGLSQSQAMALVAYHGSVTNIRQVRDVKALLKSAYLRDLFSDRDAERVLNYLSGVQGHKALIAGNTNLEDCNKRKKKKK